MQKNNNNAYFHQRRPKLSPLIHLKKFKSVFLIINIKDNSKYLKEMSFINRFLVKLMMKKLDGAIFYQKLELFNEDPNNILSSSCKQLNHN